MKKKVLGGLLAVSMIATMVHLMYQYQQQRRTMLILRSVSHQKTTLTHSQQLLQMQLKQKQKNLA